MSFPIYKIPVLILCLSLLAACSSTKVATTVVPGKELSRTVLDKRETSNNHKLDANGSYSVKLQKKVCISDYVKTENKKVLKNEYDVTNCSNIAGNTALYVVGSAYTLGLLPVMDIISGGKAGKSFFKDSCKDGKEIKYQETSDTITHDFLDTSTQECSETPVTAATIEASTGEHSFKLTPNAQGIVSLPVRHIAYLENKDKQTTIVWQHGDTRITTKSNFTPEQKQETVRRYFNKLSNDKLFNMQMNDRSGFYKADNKLMDAIRDELPKYYRLERVANRLPEQSRQLRKANRLSKRENQVAQSDNAEDQMAYRLVPTQQRMFFKSGDYSGNIELPVIDFNEAPRPIEVKTNILARKVNNLLPEYQNEDRTMKLVFKGAKLLVTNKTDQTMKLNKLSLYYNGKFIDNILDQPLELAPASSTEEMALAPVIERELGLLAKYGNLNAKQAQRMKINFGIGAAYQDPQTGTMTMLNKVNSYSVYDVVKNMAETSKMDDHMVSIIDDKSIPPSELRQMFSSSMKASEFYDPTELQFDLKVEFDSGKATIKKEYLGNLKKVGMAMKKYSKMKGIIEGHADSAGTEETNQKLSERRAAAIKQYLVQHFGVEGDRIQAEGFGTSRPIADNDTVAGKAKNRRIEGRFMEFGA